VRQLPIAISWAFDEKINRKNDNEKIAVVRYFLNIKNEN
jgi:hypothetical protein